MALTQLENLVDPEVMANMINGALPKAIKFTNIAKVDTTLTGQPGSTITVPKYAYIGDATVVAEGGTIDYSQLTTSTAEHKVQKVAKGVQLTDEAVLCGYGDPVGQAARQITMAIASKVDNDVVEAALAAPLSITSAINLDMIDLAEAAFGDEDGSVGILYVNPKDAAKLRKEAANNWQSASELGDNIIVNGVYGEALGWQIVRSKKLEEGQAVFIKALVGDADAFEDPIPALTIYMKRGVLAESGRDMDRKLTKFNADQHYVVAVTDETKIVVVNSGAAPEGDAPEENGGA